ncbi:DUF5946 family protein [candidate division KSB1 bacterium]
MSVEINENENYCPDCGAEVQGGEEGCNDLFQEVIAREFSDFRYGRVHRMTVDAYALQHSARYMKSFTSHAAHLTGLCWAFEYEGSQNIGRLLKNWYDSKPDKQKLPEPESRGKMTVVDIYNAKDAEEHTELVHRWAGDAWETWADHHDIIRSWVKEAIGEK